MRKSATVHIIGTSPVLEKAQNAGIKSLPASSATYEQWQKYLQPDAAEWVKTRKMGPKKKEKEGKKKGKAGKPPKPLKSEYLAQIAERNAVLAAARKKFQAVEDIYLDTEKRYEQTQEDMADIIKYLQHEIEENEEEIAAFDLGIAEYKKEIEKNKKYYQAIFAKMEGEYEEKEKALNYQVQQNTAKLSALEEVRQQREEYLKRKEQLHQKLKEVEERHHEEIYVAEKQSIIKQDTMQKEMEFNLIKLATDFRQASDIAIGETTNKLIRRNIQLGNMLTCMQDIFEKARDAYNKVHAMEKHYRYSADLLEEQHQLVYQKYLEQVAEIETILRIQEELLEKIKMSERLIKDNRRLQRMIAEKECILKEKVAELNDVQKVLNENEEMYNLIKTAYDTLRKNILKLEFVLFDVVKKVKYGIDIENLTRLLDENDEDITAEMSKEDAEETILEYKFKQREVTIEDAIEKLGSGLLADADMQLAAPSSDSYLASYHDSTTSNVGTMKSADVLSKKMSN